VSTIRVPTVVVLAMACFAFAACDDNPVSENRDTTVGLSVNPSFAVVDAADSTRVEATARNQYRDPTYADVNFTACDSKVTVADDPESVPLEPPKRVLVIGNTLGESCVEASVGSITEEIVVNVVPYRVEVGIADTLESGQSDQVALTLLGKDLVAVTGMDVTDFDYSTGSSSIAEVDASGNITAKAPGETDVTVDLAAVWGATKSGSASFVVVPGPFLGTATSSAGNSGDIVTYTAGGGQPDFDDDTEVTVGGERGFVLGMGSLTTAILYGLPVGETEVVFTGVGAEQLALSTTFDVAALATDDKYEPNDDVSPAGPFAIPISDIGVVDASKLDDFWRFDLAAETDLEMLLDWDEDVNGDLDLLVVDLAFTAFQCGFGGATSAIPEHFNCTLPAGSYMLWINNYAEAGLTNYHVMVTVAEE